MPEAVQESLQAKGLISAPLSNGKRGVTLLGDKVRLGAIKSRIEG